MATRTEKKKDVVIIGLGWTGAILGMELVQEGLEVLALERGPDRDTVPDFAYPKVADELKNWVRHGFMQHPKRSTITVRHNQSQTALPYRRLGAFLPGEGVGGAGMHWTGHTFRPYDFDLNMRTATIEKFGADIIPDNMFMQDYGVSYADLEPHFNTFEKVAGISGQAGNVNGEIIPGGNPYEEPRSEHYPMPPLAHTQNGDIFIDSVKKLGYHPYPRPVGNASVGYVNPYGMQLAPCNFCGFCTRYGCLNYSKSSPQTTILGALKRYPNFEYRVKSDVLSIEKAADGKTATGVTYFDEATQEEVFQPADIVIVAGFTLNNVHMMLLSKIGQPYDPLTGEGVIGRNYAYQLQSGWNLFFKDVEMLNFIGAGGNATGIDEFSTNRLDFRKLGFIGGAYINSTQTGGTPIDVMPLPLGVPSWGKAWKEGVGEWYGHTMSINMNATNQAYRENYLDLDPTYKDPRGRPLLRMTFDWYDNEMLLSEYMGARIEEIVKVAAPNLSRATFNKRGNHFTVRPYQSTHNTGGVIMGKDPKTSALNRYMQSWDVHNVFVTGASSFPQNHQYNPTGLVGGLAYWMAHAIRKEYLPNPRPLV